MEKILHKYVVMDAKDKSKRKSSNWIDVSNLTMREVQEISTKLNSKYGNLWYLEINRIKD